MFASTRRMSLLVVFVTCAIFSGCGHDEDLLDPGSSTVGVGSLQGTIRTDGALVEGATVRTIPDTITAESNAVGAYALNGLAPQSFTVSVEATGYVTATKPASIIAGRTLVLDFDLVPSTALGRLDGTVTDGDIPLAGVQISTVPPTFSVITTGDGRYDFTGVAPGVYQISAFRVGFWPSSIVVEAISGRTTTGDIGLGRRSDGTISGFVRDTAGNPVNNVLVTVYWDEDARFVTTGADGAFSFTDLETGYYVLTTQATNYYAASRSVQAWGGVDTDGTLILNLTSVGSPVPGSVAGTIWDQTYVPIAGASVTLDPASGTPVTTSSGSDGRYYFADVASGGHTLAVTATGYVDGATTVEVGPNVTATATVTLKENP